MFWIIIITVFLIAIAGICNAICDTLENQVAFNASVFHKRNPYFWCKELSWDKVPKIFNYKLDAWHLFKSAWIGCLLLAIFLNMFYSNSKPVTWKIWFAFPLMGAMWIISFNQTYKALKR